MTPARSGRRALGAVCAVAVVMLALAAGLPQLESPGPQYDEALQAGQARDFVRGTALGRHIAGTRSVELFGRPFPIATMGYLGPLKSHLLMPSFASFGASVRSLRLTTFGWALLGLVFFMGWVRQVYGGGPALLAGCLVALDPNVLFLARHDWGPFSLAFLLRCAALFCFARWRLGRREGALFAGCLLLGLGLYNKLDFVAFIAGTAAAAALACGGPLRDAFARHPRQLRSALAGFGLGVVGLAPVVADSLAAGLGAVARESFVASLPEKLRALWAMLQGSHFARSILAGGFQPSVADGPPHPASLFAAAIVVALAILLGVGIRRRREERAPALRFAVAATLFVALGILFTPGAVRVHHWVLLYPLPHLLIALAADSLWRRPAEAEGGAGRRRLAARRAIHRAAALGLAAVTLASNAWVVAATHRSIRETGGRGRWSDAIQDLARDLEGYGVDRVVSLDWGFNEQLLLLGSGVSTSEPFWRLRAGMPVTLELDPRTLFLAHPAAYSLFGYDQAFLAAVDDNPWLLEERRAYLDREGSAAFFALKPAVSISLSFACSAAGCEISESMPGSSPGQE